MTIGVVMQAALVLNMVHECLVQGQHGCVQFNHRLDELSGDWIVTSDLHHNLVMENGCSDVIWDGVCQQVMLHHIFPCVNAVLEPQVFEHCEEWFQIGHEVWANLMLAHFVQALKWSDF